MTILETLMKEAIENKFSDTEMKVKKIIELFIKYSDEEEVNLMLCKLRLDHLRSELIEASPYDTTWAEFLNN